jgi:hypothetical protein
MTSCKKWAMESLYDEMSVAGSLSPQGRLWFKSKARRGVSMTSCKKWAMASLYDEISVSTLSNFFVSAIL